MTTSRFDPSIEWKGEGPIKRLTCHYGFVVAGKYLSFVAHGDTSEEIDEIIRRKKIELGLT